MLTWLKSSQSKRIFGLPLLVLGITLLGVIAMQGQGIRATLSSHSIPQHVYQGTEASSFSVPDGLTID